MIESNGQITREEIIESRASLQLGGKNMVPGHPLKVVPDLDSAVSWHELPFEPSVSANFY
jgi:hypothetical protein